MVKGYQDFTYKANADIIAQTIGNLAVNIAAQSLATLGINITAQDLAQLVIKIAAQSVGVYLQPDWAAAEGTDKEFSGSLANVGFGSIGSVSYDIPAGKTLYITGLSILSRAYAAADGDANQICAALIQNLTDNLNLFYTGANGGASVSFRKPIRIGAGKTVVFYYYTFANHNVSMGVSAQGFEA